MSLLDQILSAEGTGKNPRSSASGVGQFIDSTWLDVIKKNFPQVAQGKTDSQILQMKSDPQYADLQRQATAAYQKSNQDYLTSKGFDPTPGNTYLAHFAGPGGAVSALSNPNAPVESILGQAAVDANPQIKGMTGADLSKWAENTINRQSGGTMDPTQQKPQGGLLASLGISNPFGGTGGALAQPIDLGGGFSIGPPPTGQQNAQGLNIGTPLGNIGISGGSQNDATKAAANDMQPSPFGSFAPTPQRQPINLASLAALSQMPRLGLLS